MLVGATAPRITSAREATPKRWIEVLITDGVEFIKYSQSARARKAKPSVCVRLGQGAECFISIA